MRSLVSLVIVLPSELVGAVRDFRIPESFGIKLANAPPNIKRIALGWILS
jgi:hypothetical protein